MNVGKLKHSNEILLSPPAASVCDSWVSSKRKRYHGHILQKTNLLYDEYEDDNKKNDDSGGGHRIFGFRITISNGQWLHHDDDEKEDSGV